MKELLLISLLAIIAESFVFSRLIGACPFAEVSKKPLRALEYGLALLVVTTLSSVLTWIIYRFVLLPTNLKSLKTILFILIVALLVKVLEILIKKFNSKLLKISQLNVTLTLINATLIGVFLFSEQVLSSFTRALSFGVLSALGFTAVLLVFGAIGVKLKFTAPPSRLKGIPILLLTAVLIAMAFSGFAGISL